MKSCEERVKNAYIYILSKTPFLASFFNLGGCVEDSDQTSRFKMAYTVKRNNDYYVYVYRSYAESVKPQELVATMLHEALHAALRHPERTVKWAKERSADPLIFNYAADALINYMIEKSGIRVPDFFYTLAHASRQTNVDINTLAKMSAEEIADLLLEKAVAVEADCHACNIHKSNSKEAGGGSGYRHERLEIPKRRDSKGSGGERSRENSKRCDRCGGNHDSNNCDVSHREEFEGETRRAGEEFARKLVDAYNRAKLAGREPGWLSDLIDRILESDVDWRALIRVALRDHIGRKIRYTQARPNRKLLGVVKKRQPPSRVRLGARRIVVSIDASGSMLGDDLALAIGDVMKIAREFNAEVVVQFWDVGTRYTAKLKTPAEVLMHIKKLKAGGGTDPTQAFEDIAKLKPDAVVVFSDLYWSNLDRAAAALEQLSRRSLVVVASTTHPRSVKSAVDLLSRFAVVVHAKPKNRP